jgi:hypothetical protein
MKLVIEPDGDYEYQYYDDVTVIPRRGDEVMCAPLKVAGRSFVRKALVVTEVEFDYAEDTVTLRVK